jgi:hypothetical protein
MSRAHADRPAMSAAEAVSTYTEALQLRTDAYSRIGAS